MRRRGVNRPVNWVGGGPHRYQTRATTNAEEPGGFLAERPLRDADQQQPPGRALGLVSGRSHNGHSVSGKYLTTFRVRCTAPVGLVAVRTVESPRPRPGESPLSPPFASG